MTSFCAACGNPTSTGICSRCGFVAPATPVVLAKAESAAAPAETAWADSTVARPSMSAPPAAGYEDAAPTPAPWESPPPPAWNGGGPAPWAPPATTSVGPTVVAHLVLWLGLLVVALTSSQVLRALYEARLGAGATAALVTALETLPFAVAVVIAGRGAVLRVIGLVGAGAVFGVSDYELWRGAGSTSWPVPIAVLVLGLATWLVARRHARLGYVLLVPAALLLLLWFPTWGPGPTIRAFPYAHGVTSAALLTLWSFLPVVALAGIGLVSSLLRPNPPRERDAVGWAVVGPLIVVAVALAPIMSAVASAPGYSSSAPSSSADYSSPSVDPAAVATAYFDAAQQGQSSVAGCNGGVGTPSVASYTIGQVSPSTSGGFDVSATVTAPDGSVETVTVHIGTTGGGSQGCVLDVSLPDYTGTTGGSDQAGGTGFPVPSVPNSSDPVPSGSTVPDGTTGGSVIPYTDSSQTPTSAEQLVAYQPSDLTGDQTAAVQSLIRFLTAVNQQDFQSAWSASTYVTKAATYTSGFAGGYATSRHYEVSFGEPQQLSSTLIAVPATFVSRQDPAAQGNPPGVTGCTYWPQYVFLAAFVDGTWLDDTAGVFTNDPAVVALKRADPSRPGKIALNPLSQRVAC